jgi:hypothetical protein
MALSQESAADAVRFLDQNEAQELFDAQARKLAGISGEEFVRRLEAGEYADVLDDPARPELMYLAMLRRIAE